MGIAYLIISSPSLKQGRIGPRAPKCYHNHCVQPTCIRYAGGEKGREAEVPLSNSCSSFPVFVDFKTDQGHLEEAL